MTMRSLSLIGLVFLSIGCGGDGAARQDEYFTSGSREADQRAEQRVARDEQLAAESSQQQAPGEPAARTLYDRLGGEAGISAIVNDWLTRAMNDPRVNWNRAGVEKEGYLMRDTPMQWDASPANVERLKKHITQFLTLATGGPAAYQGKAMTEAHRNMQISNAEFDATIGDLKATLDSLGIPTVEQKELIAVLESTRSQTVEKR
jgi:hemoglobin